MIIVRFEGGLGNQLFQYAIGRYLAYKHNTELKFDVEILERGKNSHHAFYRLNNFNAIENIATPEEIKQLTVLRETEIKDSAEVLNAPDNVYLWGFWQNEKYFLAIRDILLREFTLKNPLGKIASIWQEMIRRAKCAVSVHVRHGDYITYSGRGSFGMIYPEYYFDCIAHLKENFSDLTVFVFSDDIDWCKENLTFDVPMHFVEGCDYDFEEMYLMSLCHHNVIPNSTFSWWGAWLNPNPDKKVFVPDPPRPNTEKSTAPLPVTWQRVHAEYSVDLSPMLSIIVCIDDDFSALNLAIETILRQEFTDYEVILVDASKAGANIATRLAGQKNITLMTADYRTTKISAWNKGLDVARGDYVLFLTAKEILFPHATKILADICDRASKQFTFETLVKKCPDVICANGLLEEDDAGQSVITGIPDKKFTLKTDDALQNLYATAELKIANEQKIIALATHGISNELCTKFFTRTFLNEHSVKFVSGGGGQLSASLSTRSYLLGRLRSHRACFAYGLSKF